ncbi:MAG: GFA family protein [Pseudomonadota bacterium]
MCENSEDQDLTGRCFCGQVTWKARPPVLWAAICHCEDCRRAASSDYVSWFGVKRSNIVWNGKRTFYASSEGVTRSFCPTCGAPMSFETDIFPKETHLYAVTLDDLSRYQPTAHIFWSERVPWVQVSDALPKHPKGLQNAAKKGETLIERAT